MLTDKHAHAFLWGGGSIFVSGSLVTVYVAAISCNKKAPEKRRGACWGGAAEKTEKEEYVYQWTSWWLSLNLLKQGVQV